MIKILMVVLLVSSMAGSSQPAVREAQICAVGKPLPHFVIASTDGKKLRASDLLGHPAILSFWATWCAPCLNDMGILDDAMHRYRKQGIAVLGMVVDEPRLETVRRDLATAHAHYPQFLVPDDMEEAFDVQRGLPLTIFIDRGGIVRKIFRGELTAAVLDQQIRVLAPATRIP